MQFGVGRGAIWGWQMCFFWQGLCVVPKDNSYCNGRTSIDLGK